ncbi:MAG TPA: lipocalin family protein [Flavitalea sp.]|nr:lipocalin family protein [Flavitalea sp.]
MKMLLAAFCMFVIVVSCSKDESSNDCSTTKEHIAGSYKVTANTYKQTPSSTEENLLSNVPPCELDDVITLNTNGTYQLTDAGMACDPLSTDNGTWSLSGSTLTIDGDATTIKSFNCKTLVAVATDAFVPGDQITLTLTRQ